MARSRPHSWPGTQHAPRPACCMAHSRLPSGLPRKCPGDGQSRRELGAPQTPRRMPSPARGLQTAPRAQGRGRREGRSQVCPRGREHRTGILGGQRGGAQDGRVLTAARWAWAGSLPSYSSPSPPSPRPHPPRPERDQNVGWESRARPGPGARPASPLAGPARPGRRVPTQTLLSFYLLTARCPHPPGHSRRGARPQPPSSLADRGSRSQAWSFSQGACPGLGSGPRVPVSCPVHGWEPLGGPSAPSRQWPAHGSATGPASNHPGNAARPGRPSALSTICKPFTSSLQVRSSAT